MYVLGVIKWLVVNTVVILEKMGCLYRVSGLGGQTGG